MTEARDTVLSETELDYRWRKGLAREQNHLDAAREVAKAQAEITAPIFFKAGQDSKASELLDGIPAAIAQARKNGIREVVEWVTGYLRECHRLMGNNKVLITQDDIGIWQAQLKDWGIK